MLPVGVAIATNASATVIRTNRAMAKMLALPVEANSSLSAPVGEAPVHFKVFSGDRVLPPHELPIQVAVRENRTVVDFEETIVHENGTKIFALANAVPLRDEQSEVRGCVATFQDVTVLAEMEQNRRDFDRKLQDTQKLESLGVLAGGIAHDFNNILTGILGNASLARMEVTATSPLRPFLENIETASHRAADLCRQMLAYSGKGRFVVQNMNLSQLVDETVHMLNISIGKNCLLRLNLASAMPPVTADATQMRQIIMNLVINASEAIGERSGVIALSTGLLRLNEEYIATLLHPNSIVPGDFVFLEVSDDGGGMDATTLRKIFDPFFTTKFTGRGLGLAAVLGIIRGHKGGLKVYSEVGRGTTFRILFPISEGAVETAPVLPANPAGKWSGQGTVLVVDDEETVRTISGRILEASGFSVVLAADGREAVAHYRQEPARFVLVLLDLTMPHMDSEETFRQLRQTNPGVRVLLMSGFNQQEAVGRFTGKGLAGFVQKPFAVDGLITAVRSVLLQS